MFDIIIGLGSDGINDSKVPDTFGFSADVLDRKNKYNTTFRNAAYILAAERIIEAMGK